MSEKPKGYFGQSGLATDTSEVNSTQFMIQQALGQVRTTVPVKIVAVHGGGVGAPPTVDVQPLIAQIDGQGNRTDHGIIHGIPCARSQGGGNAIINDPKVGDVGMMKISDRDMSALKSNQGAASNPGSFRTHDLADGVYEGPILNPASPDQYVQFTENGLKVVTKGGASFEMDGTTMTIDANVVVNGSITTAGGGEMISSGSISATGNVTAGAGTEKSVGLQTHTHPGTPPPTPGT